MNFDLTEDQSLLQSAVREFAENVVRPRAAVIDQSGEFPKDLFHQAGQLGLAGVSVPVEHGGSGMDVVAYSIVIEEISRVCANLGVILSVNNSLVCDPIEKFGNADQKTRFLEPLAKGEKLGCFALTEPNAGSDAANQQTRAVSEGGHWKISGQKVFITCGSDADVCVLFAMTSPEKKSRGISAFLVDAASPGFDRSRHQVKLGVNASGTVEIFLTDVLVPAENMLGNEGDGFKIAMSTLDGGRIGIAAQAVGIATEAMEAAVRYAKARRAFGKAIAEFQVIRFYLADMATDVDAARLLTRRAAAVKDMTKKNGGRYGLEAAEAKLFAAEMAQRVTTKALQIHGGYGYTKEYPVERNFRDARITEIYEGTSEIHRLIIAREIFRDAGLAIG
ncbi:MAG: acyl-CoA dehydrogenase family protein [Acidobacteria bacterium]|nr:acyl-CoA dehydrogenase family protein [Acidobacteriota bacterium]MCA1610138.1 acyl-CoA dehydrogenase family protein [Acidobacteriota bacterium]MCA1617275.1 acyl-CoA dehydrogenase family protein [Acidobacteriota bacterium]